MNSFQFLQYILVSGLVLTPGASSLQPRLPTQGSGFVHTATPTSTTHGGGSTSSRSKSNPAHHHNEHPYYLFIRGGGSSSNRDTNAFLRSTTYDNDLLTSYPSAGGAVQDEDQERYTIPTSDSISNNPAILTSPVTSDRAHAELSLPKKNALMSILQNLVPAKSMVSEIVAEGFGTFMLLHLALGIVLSANFANSMTGVFPIAILTGGAITASCAAVGTRSAAHFNPAITFSMCLYRKFGWNKFVPYVGAQMVGATLAALVNYGVYAAHIAKYEAANQIIRSSPAAIATAKTMGCYFAAPVSPLVAFCAETLGTFCLTATVFGLTHEQNKAAKGMFIAPIIGSVVALIISIVGPISCASLNPARELGPRLVMKMFGWSSSVAFSQVGVYVTAAMLGATLAGLFVDKVLYRTPKATTTTVTGVPSSAPITDERMVIGKFE